MAWDIKDIIVSEENLCGGLWQSQFKLHWASNEIINTKKKEISESTHGLKIVFFQEAKAPDDKCRRPQGKKRWRQALAMGKKRWRQALAMSRCRGEVRKGRGDLNAYPVAETTWSGSMACFLLCPMPGWSLCASEEGNGGVLSLKCHWNISFPFNVVTTILELNSAVSLWAILQLLSVLLQYCWVLLCLLGKSH